MSNLEDRIAARRKHYKKTGDTDDTRRRREDETVQIRKAEKEKQLAQRRRMSIGGDATAAAAGPSSGGAAAVPNLQELSEAVAGCNSPDPVVQFKATQYVRKLLSIEKNPPIEYVIEAGLIPRMVDFLKDINRPDLQFEAAWVLTNIASGTRAQTEAVVAAGTIPVFIALLSSPSLDVKEQAVWALGNIAGDSPPLRDTVLQAGVMQPLLALLRENDKFSLLRNATWALSNLCRGKPQPPIEMIVPALPTLSNLLYSHDVEVLTDACWALSYISDGPNERIEAVIEHGVCRRLVELLNHDSTLVQTPALRTVGNIVTGDDRQTQVIIQCGVSEKLYQLLYSPKKNIRKEACWTISNITAGNREQIQEIINAGIASKIVELMATAEFDIKKEAAWALSNATTGGTPEQVDHFVQAGCIKPLCALLDVNDTRIVGVCLEALENILRVGLQAMEANPNLTENPYLQLVEEADGLTKIENLQSDSSDEIYLKAVRILENYFPLEGEDDIEEMEASGSDSATAPPTGGFNFGGATNTAAPPGGFQFGGN
ncbi:Importin alpha subunit (Karyopherin alpha subunit) (Serine-rich RNA polymerase I suppressor protein) [Perkinsus olseni]|uniref:Importin subunit alpha n=1 Tax=Perkinsus olseni TaxID=32597 RepID=A0A7J6UHJ4_PEROL|nr:Importin alpha subunit (Karyopherin alpha subunit) (Serine-rich RNA polymerase I suppressor protein) [Perkinsus olseni]